MAHLLLVEFVVEIGLTGRLGLAVCGIIIDRVTSVNVPKLSEPLWLRNKMLNGNPLGAMSGSSGFVDTRTPKAE
jgi:hypothetical protein